MALVARRSTNHDSYPDDAGSDTASVYTACTSFEHQVCELSGTAELDPVRDESPPPYASLPFAISEPNTHIVPPFPIPGDWKGHDPRTFGHSRRQGRFQVIKASLTRSYDVYLFDNILLLITFYTHPTSASQVQANLKGRIFVRNISNVQPNSASHSLTIEWSDASPLQTFTIILPDTDIMQDWLFALLDATGKVLFKAVSEAELSLQHFKAAAGPPVLSHNVEAALAAGLLPYVPGSVSDASNDAAESTIFGEAAGEAHHDANNDANVRGTLDAGLLPHVPDSVSAASNDAARSTIFGDAAGEAHQNANNDFDEQGLPDHVIRADQDLIDGPAHPFRASMLQLQTTDHAGWLPIPKQGFVVDVGDEPRHAPWPHIEEMYNTRSLGRVFRRSRINVERRGKRVSCDVYLYEVAILVVENAGSSARVQVDLVYMLDIIDVQFEAVHSNLRLRLSWLDKTKHCLTLQSHSSQLLEDWRDDMLCLMSDRLFCDIHRDDTLSTPSCGRLLLNDDFSIVSGSTRRNYRVVLYEKVIFFCNVTYPTIGEGDSCMPVYKIASRISIASIVEVGGLLDRSSSGINTYWLRICWTLQNIDMTVTVNCRRREVLEEWTSQISGLVLASGTKSYLSVRRCV